jgi:Fe-S-cluster containining protein
MHIFGFWIPKLSRIEPLEQRKDKEAFLLSEPEDKDRVRGEIQYIHPDTDRVKIVLEKGTPSFPEQFSLERLFYDDESGVFFFYTDKSLNKTAIENIRRSIYSVFKEMFHSHKHHTGDEDSILVSYLIR